MSSLSPESKDSENQLWTGVIVAGLIVIAAPVAVLVAAGWFVALRFFRVPVKYSWWMSGVLTAGVGLLALLGWVSVPSYVAGYSLLVDSFTDSGMTVASIVGAFLVGQGAVGLWVGTLAMAGLFTWRARRRGERLTTSSGQVKVTRRARKRWAKTVSSIEQGVHGPSSGTTLGVSAAVEDVPAVEGVLSYGQRVVISDVEASGHVLVVGGSGSGKTQSMLSNMRDAIRLGRGVVVVDCKGGPDVPEQLASWADRYDRVFLHWSIHDPQGGYSGPADGPAFYDPISRGDASRRKDLLIGAHRWDVEYYKSVIANYLQTAFRVMDVVPPLPGVDSFTDIAELLSPRALEYRAKNIPAAEQPQLAADLTRLTDMDRQELSGIRSMYARLHTLVTSTAGAWLRRDPAGERDIDLRKVAEEGQVVVFSLDTSNYEETATLLAGLIVQDLKTLSSELRHSPAPAPLHVYVDEFSAVDSTNILGLLSKARDARMPVMMATQALADLQRTEPTFVDQVLGIVSSFVVHRANTAEDARTFAGLSGMRARQEDDARLGEEFSTSQGVFQKLEQGQCVYITKNPMSRVVDYVQVIPESPNFQPSARQAGVDISERVYHRDERGQSLSATYPHPASAEIAARGLGAVASSPAGVAGRLDAGAAKPNRPQRPARVAGSVEEVSSDAAAQDQHNSHRAKGKAAGSPIPGIDNTQ